MVRGARGRFVRVIAGLVCALALPALPATALAATQTIPFFPTGSMNTPRYDLFAAPLADGRVLVGGGYDGMNTAKSTEIFNPATGAFTPAAGMSVVRQSPAAALLVDGRVLVAGGFTGSS